MKKGERVLSLLLAILMILTGVPVGAFGSTSYAEPASSRSNGQVRLFNEDGSRTLPSLIQPWFGAETEDSASAGQESQTVVTGSDITSSSSLAEPANEAEERDSQSPETISPEETQTPEAQEKEMLEAVRRELEKNPFADGKVLPVQDLVLNGNKALSRVNYVVNRDQDGLPQSITWVLTYFAPKEKNVHNAFVVTNGDHLEQPTIAERTYTSGEEAAMKAREAARKKQAEQAPPLFLYETETKEADQSGYFLTTVTTPIHRDETIVAKINAAKAKKDVDQNALAEVNTELEGRIYTLDMISLFGAQKQTRRVQINGKGDLTATDANALPLRHDFAVQKDKENRVLFVEPNQEEKETFYKIPVFSPSDADAKNEAEILIYDFVLTEDGFYDFLEVERRSLAQYEKQLQEVEEKGLTGDELQNARKAATLMVQSGQFALTLTSKMVKTEEASSEESQKPNTSTANKEESSAAQEEQKPQEEKKPQEEQKSASSEQQDAKNNKQEVNDKKQDAPAEGEKAPWVTDEARDKETREGAAKSKEILPLGKTLAENGSLRKKLQGGKISDLMQPMGAPLNPFVANRPIIIEVVDRDNKGVKIPGAVVRVTGPGMIKELTTGEDGRAVLENANVGNYEVVQVSAPEGYFPNQTKIAFHFSAIETTKYVRIDNAKNYGTKLYFIEGTVADEKDHNQFIAGVELELRAYENNHGVKGNRVSSMNRTAYTNDEGKFVFNDLLPQYIYEVVIVNAPYTYSFAPNSKPTVENGRIKTDIKFVDAEGQPIVEGDGVKYKETLPIYLSKSTSNRAEVVVFNHETGDQQVSIVGSAFQVLDEHGEVIKEIGVLRTDGQGKISFMLRPGQYTIQQLTTDRDHLIPNDKTPIVVAPIPHDPVEDVYLIPNPLKDIGSVTYNMEAVINWGAVPPDPDAKIILKRNGEETDITPQQIGQVYRFSNLPKYDENHEQISYRIELKDHPEYYATYNVVNGVVNIEVHEISTPEGPGGTVTVTGNKVWYNDSKDLLKRPATVHVVLLENGVETRYRATVSEATDWKYSFTNLPRFDKAGKEIVYTVKEVQMAEGGAIAGYRMDETILGKNVLNTKIDHSKIGGEFTLEKTDEKGNGLEGAQFTLSGTMDNGKELTPRSLKTDAKGKLTFKDLPSGTYTLKETLAPDRYEPSTETWQVQVFDDGQTILVGNGEIKNATQGAFPEQLRANQEFVKDGEGSNARTIENEKARNPVPFKKTIYTQDNLSPEEQAKNSNQVGDISKRILNTVDKNLNEYQVELTVEGRGRSSFAGGETTDIVLVVDHSASIKKSRNEDQVRSQVRNIVSAFSNFSNVRMGYVEYAGIAADIGKRLQPRDDNFSDYNYWNSYESNDTYTRDPAVRSSVELTTPGQLASDPKFNTNRFDGGTFTQRALLRAKEILDKGNAKNKHIILITDGGPTLSFSATGSKPNGTRPDGTAWEPIYKPNPNIPNDYAPTYSGDTYNGRASGFRYDTLRGDGLYYQFGTSKNYTDQLAYSSYRAGNDTILDNVFATISTVRDLTEQNVRVTTVGYNLVTLNNAGWFNGQEKYFFPLMASTPKDYSGISDVNDADNAVNRIYDEVSKQFYLSQQNSTTPTINKATVTDPMGEGVELYVGEDGVFNEKDYVLVASDGSIYKNGIAPKEGLLKDVTLEYDQNTRQFTMKGLTLGKGESVSLYYSVRLKEEYRDGNFVDTNKRTTIQNGERTDDFPIPAIRDRSEVSSLKVKNQAYTSNGRFRIIKKDENNKPLAGAYFVLRNNATQEEVMIQPSGKDGTINVNNLPQGTYTLEEVEAPAGYVVSGLTWTITVDAKGKTTITQKANVPQKAPAARSADAEAMGDLLEMGSRMGLAAVRARAPQLNRYKITAKTEFNDADPNNKMFTVHHESTGKTILKELDLYFLLVPESQQDLTTFNNRIRDYNDYLAQHGYQGIINVIYGGYDEPSTQYTYWRIGNAPDLLTNVPVGRTPEGAWMDRAIFTANDILYRHLNDDTVKFVTFLSSGRDFAREEMYYTDNLKTMIESHAVSRYINLVTNPANRGELLSYLNDNSSPLPAADRQEMREKLDSNLVSGESAAQFESRIKRVYGQFTEDNTVSNESLVIPLAENIRLVGGTQTAKIVNDRGELIRDVRIDATTDPVSGLTTLRSERITLRSGQHLLVDYSVTLKGDYKRAISYPVYATGAVEWQKPGSAKDAGIKAAYVSDPGQNLQIDVRGLEGYPNPVDVKVTTNRPAETETFSLKNNESASKTILTFDANGNTQGKKVVTLTADPAPNGNYQGPKIDKSDYPILRVLYERKKLNLTVRKVYNNRVPQPGESLDVTLLAKVDGQAVNLATVGYNQPATRTLAQKTNANGQLIAGVYETVYEGLPLQWNGKEIVYEVASTSGEQDQGDNIKLIREETVTNYRPDEDLIQIEETELPVLTVINTTNKLEFKKVGESGQQKDEHGNPIVGPDGKPIISEVPLAGTEFELRREVGGNSYTVEGYEKILSGPNGEFSFKNLPPGDYGVYEKKPVLGYELPVQAVATFTIDANGKPINVKSFKDRTNKDGDYILGIQKTLLNNVSVETAITQVEATDHNQGNRKMLYTQRVYVNRNEERMTEANFSVFSAAADNPIVNGSYKVWKVTGPRKPDPMDFNKPLDTKNYDIELVKKVDAPANLSKITIDNLPSNAFYLIEVKGKLEIHDEKFTSKLNFFISATEGHGEGGTHGIPGFKPSDDGTIITGFRKGQQGDDADIMVDASKDPETGAYLVKNYRGSTYFSVQKTREEDGAPLAGAKFKLWAALGKNFEIVETEHTTQVTTGAEEITDENGIITFDNLPTNYNFYLEETETAPGFALPDYLWIVQIRPVATLESLQAKPRDWRQYLPDGKTEATATEAEKAKAQADAASVAYNQMLYPYGGPYTQDADGMAQEAIDKIAKERGFKVFVYQTDGRKPLIVHPKNEQGKDLPANTDSKDYKKDKYDDVIAEQSYGDHPTIKGMWYRKGWVAYSPQPATEPKGQMMPINEYGQPIQKAWTDPNRGWLGETLDGVSGATIRPLIVKDWIQTARDFDAHQADPEFPHSAQYDALVKKFRERILPARDLTIKGQTIPSVLGITNARTEFFINKVDEEGKPLEGADFMLFKLDDAGNEIEPGIKPTRTAKHQFIFDGLTAGTYRLRETKIPEGYQKPTTYWEITVDAKGVVTKKEEKLAVPQKSPARRPAQAPAQLAPLPPQGMLASEETSLLTPVALRLAASPLSAEGKNLQPLHYQELLKIAAKAAPLASPMAEPVRGAGEFYEDDNRNIDSTKNQQIYRANEQVDLGIKFTSIWDVNVDSGKGTFEARIYIDPQDTELYGSGDRTLVLEPKSNVTLTGITQYALNNKKFTSVNFNTDVSKIKGNMLGTGARREISVNASNRYALDVNPNNTRYLIVVKGTYQNASLDPLRLTAKYEGRVKKPDIKNQWGIVEKSFPERSSQAQATSQVYHYDRYLVTYKSDNQEIKRETVRHQRSVNAPTPQKTGYQFNGWSENGVPVNLQTSPYQRVTADHDLVAEWNKSSWTVSFYDKKGISYSFFQKEVNDGQLLGQLPTEDDIDSDVVEEQKAKGFRFAGWADATGVSYDEQSPITENLSLYPVWEANVWRVDFFDHNGQYKFNKTIPNGKTFREVYGGMPDPVPNVRAGYTFKGWIDYFDKPFTENDPVTRDRSLRPVWEKKDTVVLNFYMLNSSGYYLPDTLQVREVERNHVLPKAQIPSPIPATKEGYTFSGWKTYDSYYGLQDVDWKNASFTRGQNFYGDWVANKYQVTFLDEKGALVKTVQDIDHGTYINAPGVSAREGYTFLGWKSEDGIFFDAAKPVTASATYKATWEKIKANQVVVSFDTQGGSAVPNQIIDQGTAAQAPAEPKKVGWNFAGWTLNGQPYDFTQPVNQNITLVATWTEAPDPGTLNELTVTNKKKDFEGEFTLDKFHKVDGGNRVKLGNTFFKFSKRDGAKLPLAFDAAEYAKQYSNPYWDVDSGCFKTDADGKLFLNHLQPGVYDLVEQTPPGGYLANPTKYVVVVNEIGNTIIVPEEGYDPEKYPIEVEQEQNPGENPDLPQKRTEPKSLDAEIMVKDYRLSPSHEAGIVRPLDDQRLYLEYTIQLPEDVIKGDTFTITLDKNLNFHGIRIDPEELQDILSENGHVVANTTDKTIDKNGSVHKITYTMTEYVDSRTDIVIKQQIPVFVDPDQVKTDQALRFVNFIGNEKRTSETIQVTYNPYFGSGYYIKSSTGWTLNNQVQHYRNYLGGRFYEDRDKHQIELYYYAFGYNNSWETTYRLELEAKGNEGQHSDVIFNDPQNPVKVSVYKVDAYTPAIDYNTQTMPPSYGVASMDLREENRIMKDKEFTAENGKITIPLDVMNDYPEGRFGYIVKVTAPFANKDDVELWTFGKLQEETYFYDGREPIGPYVGGGVKYWNYLSRHESTDDVESTDLMTITLTKRGLSGVKGENKYAAKLLPGAGFKLTNNQGYKDYVVTDEDGKLTFSRLKPGDYFLEEVLTPKGYTPPYVVWDIHVAEDGMVTIADQGADSLIEGGKNSLAVWNIKTKIDKPVLQFPNIPNRVEFTKLGESENTLEGAVFELRRADTVDGTYKTLTGTTTGPKTSGKDGKFSWSNLTPGFYQVWETTAPEGYVKPNKEVATFEVDKATGKIVHLQIEGRDPVGENNIHNRPPMKIELSKVDEKLRAIGEGTVTFRLDAAENNPNKVDPKQQRITLNLTKGEPYLLEIPDNLDGEYLLSEVTPPTGYVKTTNRYHITIDRTNRTVRLTKVTNDQGTEIPYLDRGLLSQKPIDLYADKMVDQVKLQVVNHLYYTLPTTAGPGTFLFTLAGAFLLSLAFGLFRKSKGNDGRSRKRLLFLRRQLE